MKVFVLNPPFKPRFGRTGRWHASPRGRGLWAPKWLAYAVGVLEREGNEVDFVDAPAESISVSDLEQRVRRYQPQLIICDTSTPSFKNDAEVISRLKEVSGAYAAMVGTHVSALPEMSLRLAEGVDFVIFGEYDYTIAELAKTLSSNGDFSQIKGLVYREGERIIRNEPRPLIEDLDSLPFLTDVYRKYLNIRNYSLDFCLYPYIDIMTGRGCPHKCVYCLWNQTLMGRKYRVRSLDNMFQEIDKILANVENLKEIFIDDDTFTIYNERVREFCERIIKQGYHFTWSANARASIVDEELIDLMAEAGCRLLVVGYESGSQEILDNSKKGTRLDIMKRFTRLCKSAKIKIHGDFMIGLPGETKETISKTLHLAKELNPETYQISLAAPYPGTEFYRWLEENSYLTTRVFEDWLDEAGQQKCVVEYPNLSKKDMEDAVKKALVQCYLNPRFLFKLFRMVIAEPRELQRYLIGGRGFIKQLFRWYILRK